MNREDVRLLNDSIAGVGNAFERGRFHADEKDSDMQRIALERQMRDSNENHQSFQEDLATKRFNADNQPKVRTYLAEPNNPESGMLFEGTPEQLNTIKSGAQKSGKVLSEFTEPPSRDFAAIYSVGGAKYSFHNETAANNFANALKSKGIDVHDEKYAGGRGAAKGLAVSQALETAAKYRDQASVSQDPTEAQQLNEFADITEAWAKKQSQFAPPKAFVPTETNYGRDDAGNVTNKTTRALSPNPVSLNTQSQVPPPDRREAGKTYRLPKGNFTWTGTGWIPVQ